MKPLLSICIPTKNRYKYLFVLIKSFSKFKSDDFEFVIQDNSDDNNEILALLSELNDSRFKYFYDSRELSVVDNSNYAVKNSSGEYLCMIGDDDGVVPSILTYVEYLKHKSLDGAYVNVASYYWGDIKMQVHNLSGTYRYSEGNKQEYQISPLKELKASLREGATSMFKMPKLYHSIISRKSLDKVSAKCGTFFPGPSPDMANAVALSLVVDKYVYCDKPYIIAGASYVSGAGAGARKEHVGNIEEMKHLPKDTAAKWHDKIPRFWSGPTIWGESALRALEEIGELDYLKLFNYNYLYASYISFNFSNRNKVKGYVSLKNIVPVLCNIFKISLLRFKFLCRNLLLGKVNTKNQYFGKNIVDIDACITEIDKICCK